MKTYELETIVTVEATEIAKAETLPDSKQLAEWKQHVAHKISEAISEITGNENYIANVKVQVFVHEKEDTI